MKPAFLTQIQHFSVGDGPGIRTTVFFKGCNLRCPWCHNPETVTAPPSLLCFPSLCARCGRCAACCPRHTLAPDGVHRFDRTGCTACGSCAAACPTGALSLCGRPWTLPEILEEILADRDFYAASGGGVTLSGGEALLQPEACAAIASACRKEGVPVLLDTAGNTGFDAFEPLLPFLNDCYFDLKSAAPEGYRSLGGSLDRTLRNLSRLTAHGVHTVARIPVIPGFNDSLEEIGKMAALLRAAGVTEAHLLPFHRLGSGKYAALGLPYPYADTLPPPPEHLSALLSRLRAAGLTARIAG